MIHPWSRPGRRFHHEEHEEGGDAVAALRFGSPVRGGTATHRIARKREGGNTESKTPGSIPIAIPMGASRGDGSTAAATDFGVISLRLSISA